MDGDIKLMNILLKTAQTVAINAHSSLLPDYKGASVYNHYWANVEHIQCTRFS